MFIMYDWTSNSIMVTPMKGAIDDIMVEALKKMMSI